MEYECADPNATVRAANVRSTLDAFAYMPSMGQALVARHGLPIEDLHPDNRVPVQRWLDAMKELAAVGGTNMLRAVGSAIIRNADFPPHLDSVPTVLTALDTIYYANHDGDVGHYVTRVLDDGAIEVECSTPYPREFERGLVEGICSHPDLCGDIAYIVHYSDGPPDSDVSCILTVRTKA
ncbi:MAG: hypothetical protein AAF605_00325 [Myxococcota bacterium]